MKKLNKLFTLLLIAVLIFQIVTSLQLNFISLVFASPVTVTTEHYLASTQYSFLRKNFYMANRHWVFYSKDVNGRLCFRSSVDGVTWSGSTEITDTSIWLSFSGYYNGSMFAICWGSQNKGLWFRLGTPVSDGTFSWVADWVQVNTTAITYDLYPFVTLDYQGYPWIGYCGAQIASCPYVTKSDWNNGSWLTSSGFPYQLSAENQIHWGVNLCPLANGDLYAIYLYNHINSGIRYQKYSSGSWGSEAYIPDTNLASGNRPEWGWQQSSTVQGNKIHFVYVDDAPPYQERYSQFNGVSWSATTTVVAVVERERAPCIAVQDATEDVYVFFSNLTSDHIYYRKFKNSTQTWESIIDWIDESSNGLMGYGDVLATDRVFASRLAAVYTTAYPYKLRHDYITVVDSTPPTYSNIGYNTTLAGQNCAFSCKWADDVALSGYVFSWNSTGDVWQNDTWATLSGNPAWANVTKTLPPESGVIQGFRWYCNDTNNNWNDTGIQTLTTTTSGTNMVSLFFPYNVTSQYANSLNFLYYAKFYQTIQNSSLWLNLTGTWQRAAWNATPVINDSQFNPITFNFSTYGSATYVWSVEVFNTTGSQFAIYNRTLYVKLEPRYTLVSYNSTAQNEPCLFYSAWIDADGLSGFIFGWNGTGSMVNETWTPTVSGWANTTKTLPADGGTRIEFQFWVNDTDNYWNTTGLNFLITISNAPTITVGPYGPTLVTANCTFSAYATDDAALSGFIFSWNYANGTTFYNDTWTALSGNASWMNVTKELPNVIFDVYFRWYCNDSNNNWATSGPYADTVYGFTWMLKWYDLDNNDAESYITWILWNGSTQIDYNEGYPTLLNGTYQMVTYFRNHMILNSTVDTITYGNGSTLNFYPVMKKLGGAGATKYVAFNQSISTITIITATETLIKFTVTSSASNFLMILDVTQNCTDVTKDGVSQTWTYTLSPTTHVYLEIASLSTWEFTFGVLATHELYVDSIPTTISFSLAGSSVTTPYTITLEEGTYLLIFPSTVTRSSITWTFSYWKDAPSNTNPLRYITLTADTELIAIYTAPYVPLNYTGSEPVFECAMNNMFELDGMLEGNDTYRQMLLDSSAYENHGKIYPGTHPYAGPILTWGRIGKGLQFDGVNDYIVIAKSTSLSFTESFTVEFWFAIHKATGNQVLFHVPYSWTVGVNNGVLYTRLWTTSGNAYVNYTGNEYTSNITTGAFYFFSLTFDYRNAYYTVWLHGDPQYNVTTDGNMMQITTSSYLYIGTYGAGGIYFFKGVLDEVRIFPYARTINEIYNDAKTAISRFDTWSFINSGLDDPWVVTEGVTDGWQGFTNNDPELPWAYANNTYIQSFVRTIKYVAGFQQYQIYFNLKFTTNAVNEWLSGGNGLKWYWCFFKNGLLQVTYVLRIYPRYIDVDSNVERWGVAFERVTPYEGEIILTQWEINSTYFQDTSIPLIVTAWVGPNNKLFSIRIDAQDSRLTAMGANFPFTYAYELIDRYGNTHIADWFDGWVVVGIQCKATQISDGTWSRSEIESHKLSILDIVVIATMIVCPVSIVYYLVTGGTSAVQTVVSEITNVLKPIVEFIGSAVKIVGDAVVDALAGLAHDLIGVIGGLATTFSQLLSPLIGELMKIGSYVVSAIIAYMGAIVNAIIPFIGTIMSKIAEFLGPTVIGFLQNWFVGIAAGYGLLLAAVFAMFGFPMNPMAFVLTWMLDEWNWVSAAITYSVSLVGDFFTFLASWFTQAASFITVVFTNWALMAQYLIGFFSGLYGTGYNIWVDFNLTTWLTVGVILYPIYLVFLWEEQGGQAVIDQITFMVNMFSFIVTFLLRIIEYAWSGLSRLIEMIPLVE